MVLTISFLVTTRFSCEKMARGEMGPLGRRCHAPKCKWRNNYSQAHLRRWTPSNRVSFVSQTHSGFRPTGNQVLDQQPLTGFPYPNQAFLPCKSWLPRTL